MSDFIDFNRTVESVEVEPHDNHDNAGNHPHLSFELGHTLPTQLEFMESQLHWIGTLLKMRTGSEQLAAPAAQPLGLPEAFDLAFELFDAAVQVGLLFLASEPAVLATQV